MNTKTKGELSEAAVLFAFIKRGVLVATPHGDNQRYDLIAEIGNKLFRIQIKTARRGSSPGSIYFSTRSVGYRGKQKRYTANEVDLFAAYDPATETTYVVPIAEAATSAGFTLRTSPSANGQTKGMHFATEYTLDAYLARAASSVG